MTADPADAVDPIGPVAGTARTIVTVTPNPSIDRTLEVEHLELGAVLRAGASRIDAGGKGVNVARALVTNGRTALAVVPLGGPDGKVLADLLASDGIPCRSVPVPGATRTNITLAEPDGRVTKINAPGPALSDAAVTDLLSAAVDELGAAMWLVGCGSLPDRMRPDFYAELVERGHTAGVAVAVDTSGAPLEAALAARPDLIKPNLAELAELVGSVPTTIDEVVLAAQAVRASGAGTVVVSLGAAGAVLVDDGDPVLAIPPRVAARSDVGAGDSLLAGFLWAGARGPEALRAGVAWGAAAVSLPGTAVPRPGQIDVDAVTVTRAHDSEPLVRPPA